MDKRDRRSEEVEYVEAEPIGAEAPPAVHPMPQMRAQYQASGGCVPCCGPIGCATVLMLLLLAFGSSDFARPLIFALGIFMVVSVVGSAIAKRRGYY